MFSGSSALKEAGRMIAGGILSPDSMAEASSPLAVDARRVAKERASSAAKTIAPLGDSSAPKSSQSLLPIREAAFCEPIAGDEATPIAHDRSAQMRVVPAKSSRAPLVIAVSGFAVALATALFVTTSQKQSSGPSSAAEKNPAPAMATRREQEIQFSSQPPGARVFEAGRPIGVTPFKKVFSIDRASEKPRELIFRLDGFADSVRTVLFDEKTVEISAKLDAEPAGNIEGSELPAGSNDEEDDKDRPQKSGRKRRPTKNANDNKDPNSPYRLNPY